LLGTCCRSSVHAQLSELVCLDFEIFNKRMALQHAPATECLAQQSLSSAARSNALSIAGTFCSLEFVSALVPSPLTSFCPRSPCGLEGAPERIARMRRRPAQPKRSIDLT
jgi:hypothetical protein